MQKSSHLMLCFAVITLMLTSSVHCSKGYHGYYDYHYDFEDFYSHPSDHNHSNVTYIYHDYYVRTREGETAELCAELSNTLDEPLEIYYTSDYNISTEINEDYDHFKGFLIFEPGDRKKCFQVNITDDDIAGEEDLEAFEIYWAFDPQIHNNTVFYHSQYDDYAYSFVPIEDNDVLTLTPNVTNITVYEGDYSGICVKADQVARDGPALFYVTFDDYTSDIYDDLQYIHYEEYPDYFYPHYGGYYYIYPGDDEVCFHFHTYDDYEFEGNEKFAIKLYSFTPTRVGNNDSDNDDVSGSGNDEYNSYHGDKYHNDKYHEEYNHGYDKGDHYYDGKHSHHEDYYGHHKKPFLPEYAYFDTLIPEALSIIPVTIVDNEDLPCPEKNTPPCYQLFIDIACLRIRQEVKNKKNIPRPCREVGLLQRLRRYDPHPLLD